MTEANRALQIELALIYRKMSTEEIERRLEAGGLVPEAQAAAEAELAHRQSPRTAPVWPSEGVKRRVDGGPIPGKTMLTFAGVLASVGALALLASPFTAALLLGALGILGTGPLAKRFPVLGWALVVVFAMAPLALGYSLWKEDVSAGGGLAYFIAFIVWGIFLLVILPFSWAAAANAFFGATHHGTWDEFEQDYAERLKKRKGSEEPALEHDDVHGENP